MNNRQINEIVRAARTLLVELKPLGDTPDWLQPHIEALRVALLPAAEDERDQRFEDGADEDTEADTVDEVLVARDDGTYAFLAGGIQIDYPFESSCGRFACTPANYGFEWLSTGGGFMAWHRDFLLPNGTPVSMRIATLSGEHEAPEPQDNGEIAMGVYLRGDGGGHVTWGQGPDTDSETGERVPASGVEDWSEGAFHENDEGNLCAELQVYCETNNLPQQSAEELLLRPGLTTQQRTFLSAFIVRWDAMQAIADRNN